MKVIPLLLQYNFFISFSSICIIMLMQITLIMCQAEMEGMELVCTHVTKYLTILKLVINKLEV